jgi:hypothetical protein
MWRLLFLLALGCGSSLPGYPRYLHGTSAVPASHPAERAPEEISLHPAASAWEFRHEHAGGRSNFRIALESSELGGRSAADSFERIGEVRTGDLALTEASYLRLYCGRAWTREAAEEGLCRLAGPEQDRLASMTTVQELLRRLRHAGASLGATAVVDVRCYGWSDRRAWCEGTAASKVVAAKGRR